MSGSMTLRVLARLMDYPEQALLDAMPEMVAALRREAFLDGPRNARLEGFMRDLATRPIGEIQEEYVALFDRGRALSLHLFEHVHGESRDRGQAMADLLDVYASAGLMLDARELPDFLPLMLEYLSTRPHVEAGEMLSDAMGVIVLLGARLEERGSAYAVLFDTLEAVGGSPEEADRLRRRVATEGPDQTLEKMDEIWQEEQVTFLGGSDPTGGCSSGSAGCGPMTRDVPEAGEPIRILDSNSAGVVSGRQG